MKESIIKSSGFAEAEQHATSVVEAVIKKESLSKELQELDETFSGLVRAKIDLDAPKRRMTKELEEARITLQELKLKSISPAPESKVAEKGLLQSFKEKLSGILSSAKKAEMVTPDNSFELEIGNLEKRIGDLEDGLSMHEASELIADTNIQTTDARRRELVGDKAENETIVDFHRRASLN